MKKIILLWILILPLSLLACDFNGVTDIPKADSVPASLRCLSQSDAEKILGQPALLKERATENKGNILRYKCTWTATETDPKTNATCNVYYVLEQYSTTIAAMNAYINIVESNKNMPGLTILKGIGDEALLHTDDKNFMMVICRRGNRILRVKINKLTSMTSRKELLVFLQE